MEDDLTGRQPHRNMTSQEDNFTEQKKLPGRNYHWKTALQEDNLIRKLTSKEDVLTENNLRGRQLHRKTTSEGSKAP